MQDDRPESCPTTDLGRREFLGLAAVAAASLSLPGRTGQPPGEASTTMRPQTRMLSRTGGDRGTAYFMSNKIVRRQGHLLCTWLDCERTNRWALVDPVSGEILRQGSIGPPQRDNHCGAALATDPDGTLHLILGAHHGPLAHYQMPPDRWEWLPVDDGRAIGRDATYPSLTCDRQGTLHLTYRRETRGRDPHLGYCRRPRAGAWSQPRLLVTSDVTEHSWLTNAVEVGPDDRVHVVVSNTLQVPADGPHARYYGASHLVSDDSGQSWRQFGAAAPIELPSPAAQLKRVEGPALQPHRIESRYGGPSGPQNSYYHKMTLSNLTVDESGRPWVVVHNLLSGEAQLFCHHAQDGWRGVDLLTAVRKACPGFRIQHGGQLSRHRDGTIECVLMVAPAEQRGWGAVGTDLVRLLVDQDSSIRKVERVCTAASDQPRWLPAIERWCWHAPFEAPALLFTRGVNAGGYARNVNQVPTEIWLQIPLAK